MASLSSTQVKTLVFSTQSSNVTILKMICIGLWMDANYLEDPSHIDLNDMEGEDPVIINLRKRMVDKADKTPESLSNPKPLDVEARVPIKAKRVYRIAKIEGSAFT